MMSISMFRGLAIIGCMQILILSVWGQNATGTIAGRVTDPSNAIIVSAQVTARNEATGLTRQTVTNEVGEYRLPSLPVGTYSVEAQITGFKTSVKAGVKLEVQQTVRLDFEMAVGEIREVVSIEAETPTLDFESSASGQVIRNEQVTNLPLNVRQFMQMVFLAPFAIPATGDLRSGQQFYGGSRDSAVPATGGQRPEDNNYQIDGFDNKESGFHAHAVNPPVDSISEFRVQSGTAPAEFGLTSGTIINVVTKSGTNELHGTVYDFLRNDLFDARPFFGTTTSPLKRNQFGGSLGGPLVKDKLLLFGNYEGFRQRSAGTPTLGLVPSQDERNGIFATRIVDPLNCTDPADRSTCQEFPKISSNSWVIPKERISPISAKILDLWPQPNLSGDPARNYLFQSPSVPTNRDYLTVRGDYNASSADTLYVRYVLNDERSNTAPIFPTGTGGTNGIGGTVFKLKAKTIGGHYDHVFGPRMVNDFGFGYTSYDNHFSTPNSFGKNIHAEVGITNVLADTDPLFTGSPSIDIPGLLSTGDQTPSFRTAHNYDITENLSWQHGKHALKIGGNFRIIAANLRFTGSNSDHAFANSYSLDNFADFLLGLPSGVSKTARQPIFGGDMKYVAGYVQDDWKITADLTLNIGIRYEVETPLKTSANDMPLWDQQTGMLLLSENIANRPEIESFYRDIRPDIKIGFTPHNSFYDTDANNISPRFGFAYRINSRTALRGGFGIFYNGPQMSNLAAGNDFAPNSLRPIWTGNSLKPVLDLPDGSEIPTGYNPEGTGGLESTVRFPAPLTIFPLYSRDFPYAYNQQWMLSVQNQVTSTLSVEAQYLGSRTIHMLGYHNTNYALRPAPEPVQSRIPYPSFARIQGGHMGLDGWFDGLSLKAEQRLNHGLSYLASYTWSKSLDTGSTLDQGPRWTDPLNFWASAKGPSDYDATHRFVFSYQYELPFGRNKSLADQPALVRHLLGGWGVRGITVFQTGFPYDPTMSRARVNICAAACTARADRIGDGNLPKDIRTANGLSSDPNVAFWDYSAFVLPERTAPRIGNSGRGVLRGPGLNNWDLGLFKNFHINERTRLEFRFEMFNAWNHPQFKAPSSSLEDPSTFGKIVDTEPPRISQFVLKLSF